VPRDGVLGNGGKLRTLPRHCGMVRSGRITRPAIYTAGEKTGTPEPMWRRQNHSGIELRPSSPQVLKLLSEWQFVVYFTTVSIKVYITGQPMNDKLYGICKEALLAQWGYHPGTLVCVLRFYQHRNRKQRRVFNDSYDEKIFTHFMDPRVSLLCSQERATCPKFND